jgi:hypothetical protein
MPNVLIAGTLPIVYCRHCIMVFVSTLPKEKEHLYVYVVEKEELVCSYCGVLSFPVFNPTVYNPVIN